MIKLYPRQATGYPPLEQGQVLEMGPNCMKVNFGFRFIRGVLTGLIAMLIVGNIVLDLFFDGNIDNTIRWLGDFRDYYPEIGSVILLELYLWPSAPPMIFDRVNRRVIFQVLFRTKVIAWDSCVATIHYFAQATQASATQGYNLRIEGEVINRKPGQKPQRAAALIHQSGISEDLLNYWEYIRNYMEGGPTAVPEPLKLNDQNPFAAGWYAFKRNYPGLAIAKISWQDIKTPGRPIHNKLIDFLFLIIIPPISLMSMPLVVPLFSVAFLAAKIGRVRRYPKEIRALCKRGRATETVHKEQPAPLKLKIRIDGKLVETDWPADAWKQSPSTKQPPQ